MRLCVHLLHRHVCGERLCVVALQGADALRLLFRLFSLPLGLPRALQLQLLVVKPRRLLLLLWRTLRSPILARVLASDRVDFGHRRQRARGSTGRAGLSPALSHGPTVRSDSRAYRSNSRLWKSSPVFGLPEDGAAQRRRIYNTIKLLDVC